MSNVSKMWMPLKTILKVCFFKNPSFITFDCNLVANPQMLSLQFGTKVSNMNRCILAQLKH